MPVWWKCGAGHVIKHRSEFRINARGGYDCPYCQRIGDFKADYSPIAEEDIQASTPELDELYRNSNPLPRSP